MKLKIILYLVLFCFGLNLWSQQTDSIFNKANDAYANANYNEAKRLYQSILKEDKVSGELFFNLGNTYYKLEDIANSIYYYEKALKLSPENESIKNNLAFAERMRLDQFERLPESELDQGLNNFITLFSVDNWSVVGIVFLFVAGIVFAFFIFKKRSFIKRLSLGLSILFLLLSAGAFSMAQTQLNQINNNVFAIIFEKEKPVFEEPNKKAATLIQLHEGTKVKILDQFRSFYKVQLPDGSIGWMETTNLKKI
jgi:tetratricopeptide (TPR) repeat protein